MINPVFRRELNTSLRSLKAYIAIMVYVLVLAIFAGIILYFSNFGGYDHSFDPSNILMFYILLACFQFGLMFLIVPALTAGAISSEREKQTLNLLLVTKMSTFNIAIGKLTSSLLTVLLMIIASMPIYAIAFYYGGISFLNLLVMVLYTVLVSATIGSIAIFLSSLLKKSISATVLTFIIILAMTLGGFIVMVIFSLLVSNFSYGYSDSPVMILINGLNAGLYKAYGDTVTVQLIVNVFLSISNPAIGFLTLMESQYGSASISSFVYEMSGLYSYGSSSHLPIYIYNSIFNVFVIMIMLFLTSKVLKPVKKSRRYK